MFPRISCAALLLCLSWGCRAVPAYQPFDGAHGYSQAPVEPDVYEISFTGTPSMSATDTRFYATLRAAELAAERGREHFEIIETSETIRPRATATAGHTTIHTHTNRDRRGHQFQTTTVQSTPGHVHHYEIAAARLIVRLRDEPSESSLEALPLLFDGRQRQVKYSPQIEALLDNQTSIPPGADSL